VRRRAFIAALGGAAASLPLSARAQQEPVVIGFLHSGSADDQASLVAATRQGLKEAGYTEGQNLRIEYRWAEGRYDRLPGQAAELVADHVALIIAAGGTDPARAAKAATSTIPIVFHGGSDPVRMGFVASLARPGGNLTGVALQGSELLPKLLELPCWSIRPMLRTPRPRWGTYRKRHAPSD